jgi:hypothetical protein
MRALASAIIVSAVAGAAVGQPPPTGPADGKPAVVRFDVTPTGTLQPHARIRLLPDAREQRAGNQVQGFLKCVVFTNLFAPEEEKRRQELNDAPLDKLDLKGDERLDYGGPASRHADEAARMSHVDWQIIDNVRRDGVATLLPELQPMRQLATVLKLRTRGRIKAGAFEPAADSVATTLALGRTCQDQPNLIGGLVGIAICTIGLQGVEEMIQQPGCPNLYWALTDLPVPLIDIHTGSRSERLWTEAHFPRVFTEVWSAVELDKRVAAFQAVLNAGAADSKVDFAGSVAKWAADAKRVEAARGRLIGSGVSPDVVKAMAAGQVIVADEVQVLNVWLDEQTDVMRLPYWQAAPRLKAMEERLAGAKEAHVLAPFMLPGTRKVRLAQARLEQNVATLRTLEAIRLYAHEHGGALPPSLDDTVPVPVDQVTGKPMTYQLKDGIATLSPTPAEPSPRTNRVFEIRVRR